MNAVLASSVAFALTSALIAMQAGVLRNEHKTRKLIRLQAGLELPDTKMGSSTRRPLAIFLNPIGAMRRRHRNDLISSQLAPAISLIVGHLRIGRTFNAAVVEVSDLVPEPLRSVLIQAIEANRLGTSMDAAMQRIADKENNRHLSVVASAIGLQARHGGSLVEILESVGETIEEEDRLRRDMKTLTADNRISARVLLALPPTMLGAVSILNPGYAEPLLTDPLGRRMSIAGAALAFVGWRWLKRLGNPEVVA